MVKGSDFLESGNDVSAQRLERTFRKQFWSVLVPLIVTYSILCFLVPSQLPQNIQIEHEQWVAAQARFAALQTGFHVPLEDDTEIIKEYGEDALFESQKQAVELEEEEALMLDLDTADELLLTYGAPRVHLTSEQQQQLPEVMEALRREVGDELNESQLRERASWSLGHETQLEPLWEEWRAFTVVNGMRSGAVSAIRELYPVMEGKFFQMDSVTNLMWNWALYDAAKAEAQLHLELLLNPESENAMKNIGRYRHQLITLSNSEAGIDIVGEWFCNAHANGVCAGQNDRAPLRSMLRRQDYTEVGIARVPLHISTIELELRRKLNSLKKSLEAKEDTERRDVDDGSTATVQANLFASLSAEVQSVIKATKEAEVRELEAQLEDEKEKKPLDVSYLWVAFFATRDLPARKSNAGIVSGAHFVLPNPKYDPTVESSSTEALFFLASTNLAEGETLREAKVYLNSFGATMHSLSRAQYTSVANTIDFVNNLRKEEGCIHYYFKVGASEDALSQFPSSYRFTVQDLAITEDTCLHPRVVPIH